MREKRCGTLWYFTSSGNIKVMKNFQKSLMYDPKVLGTMKNIFSAPFSKKNNTFNLNGTTEYLTATKSFKNQLYSQ